MRKFYTCLVAAVFAIAVTAALSAATDLGNARLTSVTAVDGGCVLGPTGPFVQAWDVEPGRTYALTLTGVTECADGGTAPTLNVRVNSTDSGNTELVASYVAPGTYRFTFTLPPDAACTLPIFYCTTPGGGSSGLFTRRGDGSAFQAHLRAAAFGPGCTNPQEILGPACGAVPISPRTWGLLKILYH